MVGRQKSGFQSGTQVIGSRFGGPERLDGLKDFITIVENGDLEVANVESIITRVRSVLG
jgi:hypothetical protein